MNPADTPSDVVCSVSIELERLSSLCNVLTLVSSGDSVVRMVDISNTMGVLRDSLDAQIRTLDGIQWPGARTVGA